MPDPLLLVDTYLIWFYRITGYSFLDFLVGTFVLGLISVVIGEFTISVLFLINRKHIDKINQQAALYQNLSLEALASGDKQSYLASNKMANEAFGKSFFMQIALSAGALWPIFFSLLWMQQRFQEVEFPILFTDYSVGYVCVFITLYAAAYLIFKRIKYKLPYFRRIKEILDQYNNRPSNLKSFEEVFMRRRNQGEQT